MRRIEHVGARSMRNCGRMYRRTKDKKAYMKRVSDDRLRGAKGISRMIKTKHTMQFQEEYHKYTQQIICEDCRICYPEEQRMTMCYESDQVVKTKQLGHGRRMISLPVLSEISDKGANMNIEEFLTLAAKEEASDLFIVAGLTI